MASRLSHCTTSTTPTCRTKCLLQFTPGEVGTQPNAPPTPDPAAHARTRATERAAASIVFPPFGESRGFQASGSVEMHEALLGS